jgi:hypothetical protein
MFTAESWRDFLAKSGPVRSLVVAGLATAALNISGCSSRTHTYQVPGNSGSNWFDTGQDVPARTIVRLEATGKVAVGGGWGSYGPEGTTRFANLPGYPAETVHRYGLAARLTASNAAADANRSESWAYGDAREHCAVNGGRLWLTVNDDLATDNTGHFTVTVTHAGGC